MFKNDFLGYLINDPSSVDNIISLSLNSYSILLLAQEINSSVYNQLTLCHVLCCLQMISFPTSVNLPSVTLSKLHHCGSQTK